MAKVRRRSPLNYTINPHTNKVHLHVQEEGFSEVWTYTVDISHLHGIEWKEGHEPIRSHFCDKQIIKEYDLLTDKMMF